MISGAGGGMGQPYTTDTRIYIDAFEWTTGTVYVKASGGPFLTTITASGFDNRTTMLYYGTVQLVTPHLVNWINPPLRQASTGAIGILQLKFMPEPASWLGLLAGGALLGLLYQARHRQ